MRDGAIVFIGELPELTITPKGIVILTYGSGGAFFERAFPIDDFEEFLGKAGGTVAEWRAAQAERADDHRGPPTPRS